MRELVAEPTQAWVNPPPNTVVSIGVDLAGLLGGRMASTEGGSVSSGVAYGEGVPSPAD